MTEQWQSALKWLRRGLICSIFTFFLPYVYIVSLVIIFYGVWKIPEKSKLKGVLYSVMLIIIGDELFSAKWYTQQIILEDIVSWLLLILKYLVLVIIIYILQPLAEQTDSVQAYKKVERFGMFVTAVSLLAFSFGMNVEENFQLFIVFGAALFYLAALIMLIRFIKEMMRTGLLFLK
ncbi:hypothetical protein P9B03_15085 [Metasolibacillus meyeri]|uniref:Uncharacterized protein n=1 Tax=Metasolibacillus meyeri TaxID=1071052 RepID=A0AAW9NQJ4_9BACL|nr:hypothetical protein [Metasolibacillus meyeri]MEC1179822.1 hypothetical protein [Metasolibacillus meyeri]